MPGLSFEALLRYEELEAERWEEWFKKNSQALDLALDIGDANSVRELLLHIFGVELRSVERLLGEPQTPSQGLDSSSLESIFAIGREARRKVRHFLLEATEESLSRPREFHSATLGKITASPRKLLAHALIHGIRHWAQLATALRQRGSKQDWPHDFLFSKALE